MAMPFPDRVDVPSEVCSIIETLEEAGHEAWCVGGAIRDTLLGDGGNAVDYDVATAAHPDEVVALFPHTVAVGLRYGTVGVLDRHRRLHEVTTFRHDVRTFGRQAEVAFGASLEEDLARRDFTINAIAYHPLRLEWRDPFDGAQDLDRKLVRAVGDPGARFQEDFLRILRAVRFCARLGFTIDRPTWDAGTEHIEGLRGLSAERVREEWFKGLRTAQAVSRLVGLWLSIGAAPIWMPELIGSDDARHGHTGADRVPGRDPVVLTALLCLDPVSVLQRLKASNQDISRAVALMAGPHEPAAMDEGAVRRWLSAVGPAREDLGALWEARHAATWPWAGTQQRILERGDALSRGDLAVGGDDLLAEGFDGGPALGRTLERLLEEVVEDPALNTHETLLRLARAWRAEATEAPGPQDAGDSKRR
jgi:tRNA nucleotidyltransferase (CCA-adding enzyme)